MTIVEQHQEVPVVVKSVEPKETFNFDDYTNITEDGGLKKKILVEGNGASPPIGSKVSVHYVGTLLNGEKFDSSRDRDQTFDFTIGKGQVIKGWDQGVATMKIGEKAELICAPDYAYGEYGSPPKIPGNSTLKFEVELFDFEETAETMEKKLELANKRKVEGNEHFKSGEYMKAIACYQKAVPYLEDAFTDSDEQTKQVNDLKLSLHLNLAAAYLKVNDARAVLMNSKKALELDENCVKAYFRLGQAYNKLGMFDDARKSLSKALELSPKDAAIQKEFNMIKQMEDALIKKEKQMFGKLFA